MSASSWPAHRPGRAAAGLTVPLLALTLDGLLGEPPTWAHPVVWIGQAIAGLARRSPRRPLPALLAGAATTTIVVGGAALAGSLAARGFARLPAPLALLAEAWLLKTTLSLRALLTAGRAVGDCLDADDLAGARAAVRALVSRDAAALDGPLLASAAVESLAENTADSIIGPLLAYQLGGLPGAFAYRAANTLDAMIGYHGEYEHLGKCAARLDDLLNLVPARLSAALLLLAGAVVGGDVPTGLVVTRREHGHTESPNAGWPMSAMAGLLGARLEKPGHYRLGSTLPPPDLAAIDHAAEHVKAATAIAVATLAALRWLAERRR